MPGDFELLTCGAAAGSLRLRQARLELQRQPEVGLRAGTVAQLRLDDAAVVVCPRDAHREGRESGRRMV